MPASNFLPEGIYDSLPPEAEKIELLRRAILDIFHSWGYQLVITPMMEFTSTLLHEADDQLDRETFKVVDQISGKIMGVRADITPQIARIDSSYQSNSINRFCYIGTTMTTLPKGINRCRAPIQIGAELLGSTSLFADAEVILLVFELLNKLGIKDYIIDLTDSRIFHNICRAIDFPINKYHDLASALSRKSLADIEFIIEKEELKEQHKNWLLSFLKLNGSIDEVLDNAKLFLPAQYVSNELTEMEKIAELLKTVMPGDLLTCDYAESAKHDYYTGVSFSAYAAGYSNEFLNGGRYCVKTASSNNVTRKSVGFSTDVQTLLKLSNIHLKMHAQEELKDPDFLNKEEYLKTQKERLRGKRVVYKFD